MFQGYAADVDALFFRLVPFPLVALRWMSSFIG